ncbi:MAG: peroxiredoxin-like family protein [Chloroflexota bacterium]
MADIAPHLKIGDPAPDIIVSDIHGQPVEMASFWEKGPTLVSFLRHFGCIHCRARLSELEKHLGELQAAGLQLVTLALGETKHAERYCGKLAPHLECLADDKNDGYYAWGLQQASNGEMFKYGIDILKASAKAAASGHMQGAATGDIRMLPGTFIIDRDGIVQYAYYSVYAGDDPAINVLVGEAQKMKAQA